MRVLGKKLGRHEGKGKTDGVRVSHDHGQQRKGDQRQRQQSITREDGAKRKQSEDGRRHEGTYLAV